MSVVVTVQGKMKSGKTTIAALIKHALKGAEIAGTVRVQDGDDLTVQMQSVPFEDLKRRAKGIGDVSIITVQLPPEL